MLQIKRVYDPPAESDGARLLVERLWPRGVKKEALKLDGWLKEAAPSTGLRKWFGHDPAKWQEFQRRYRAELRQHPEAWQPILNTAKQGRVTLLFSSHDAQHNNVVALRSFLQARVGRALHRADKVADRRTAASGQDSPEGLPREFSSPTCYLAEFNDFEDGENSRKS